MNQFSESRSSFQQTKSRRRQRGSTPLQFPLESLTIIAIVSSFFSFLATKATLSMRRLFKRLGGWRTVGMCLGTLLFVSIVSHADPASAQLFQNVETQVTTIFGSNIDAAIISFMFGILRIVIWVTTVGFIFFAVYQAQRGEQWQPLIQNAFIVIAAVVVVEGMSQIFFGGATG